VQRADICYLTFILESYDGLAVVRTVDPKQSLVEILVAPQGKDLLEELMNDLILQEGLKMVPEKVEKDYEL